MSRREWTWDDFFGTLGSSFGVGIAGSVTAVGAVLLDETSLESGSGDLQGNLDFSSGSSGDSCSFTWDNIGVTTADVSADNASAGTTVLGGTGGIAGLVITSNMDGSSAKNGGVVKKGGEQIHWWEDSSGNIHINHDMMPYSRVEKRAQQAYNTLHNEKQAFNFPAVIMESEKAFSTFTDVFGIKTTPSKILETLDVLEKVLRQNGNE